MQAVERCFWAGEGVMRDYHDREWGVPVYDDQKIFEFLVLESAQAGLSWLTILKRREAYREAFAGFNPVLVAAMTEKDEERLMQNSGIIRNRRKIAATVNNARCFCDIASKKGSFSKYIWDFTDGRPIQNHWEKKEDVPALTPLSATIAKELRHKGFTFLGPTTVYAHMQAAGMINDHLTGCFRYDEVLSLSSVAV